MSSSNRRPAVVQAQQDESNNNNTNLLMTMTSGSTQEEEEMDVDEMIASSHLQTMLTSFEADMEEAIEDFHLQDQQQQQRPPANTKNEEEGDVEQPGIIHPTNTASSDVASSIDINDYDDHHPVVNVNDNGGQVQLMNLEAEDAALNRTRRATRKGKAGKKGNRRRRSTIAEIIDQIPDDYDNPHAAGENTTTTTGTSPSSSTPPTQNERLIQQRKKTICGFGLLGSEAGCLIIILLVLCVVIAVVLGAFFGFNNGEDGTEEYDPVFGITGYLETAAPSFTPSEAPTRWTAAPTPAPTTNFPIDILPLHTKESILFQKSPQARAWAWLQDDLVEAANHVNTLERYITRYALAVLFYATGGTESWTTNTHWLNHSVDECDWFMPTSDWYDQEEGSCGGGPNGTRLQHLELHRNNLTGTLPRQVALLPRSVVTIALHENPLLGGTIPSQLGILSNLQVLRLWSSQLTGNIPTQVGKLTSLLALELDDNALTGTIPRELFSNERTSLEKLHIFKNQLSGTIHTQIGLLRKMANLRMDSNYLEGKLPTQLATMTNLYRIKFENNSLTGNIPTQIGTKLSLLQEIKLDRNRLNGNSLPTELGLLTLLEELRLYQNPFGDAVGGLRGVTIPTEFGLLTNLQDLRLDDDQLVGRIPSQLGRLTQLTNLRLGNNDGLIGTIATELGQLTLLQNLQLQELSLTGKIPSQLGNLQDIVILDLSNNDLVGAIPSQALLVDGEADDSTTPAMHKWVHRFDLTGNPNLSGQVGDAYCTAQQRQKTTDATDTLVLSLNCSSVSCDCCNCEE